MSSNLASAACRSLDFPVTTVASMYDESSPGSVAKKIRNLGADLAGFEMCKNLSAQLYVQFMNNQLKECSDVI